MKFIFFFKLFIYLFGKYLHAKCVCGGQRTTYRGPLSSLPCEFQRLHSSHGASWQVPLSTEPTYLPEIIHYKSTKFRDPADSSVVFLGEAMFSRTPGMHV